MSKPVHYDMTFRFYDKSQQERFIKFLLKDEIDHTFSVYTECTDTHFEYCVSIDDLCWASNLYRISKKLIKIMGEEDEN